MDTPDQAKPLRSVHLTLSKEGATTQEAFELHTKLINTVIEQTGDTGWSLESAGFNNY